jgi:hypothetical protein
MIVNDDTSNATWLFSQWDHGFSQTHFEDAFFVYIYWYEMKPTIQTRRFEYCDIRVTSFPYIGVRGRLLDRVHFTC